MNKTYKTLMTIFVLISLIGLTAMQVRAQGAPIEAEILPSQGTATTIILLRFTTTNSSVGNVQTADIFWDNTTVALNQPGTQGADGSYNYNLTVPTEPPLSDVGNHTIQVDSTVFNYGPVSFNFIFNITEFIPSPEYLDLNATYNSLLANYTQLLINFNETSTAYASLLSQANQLNLSLNTLLANYNSLTANYNSLAANYNSQEINYRALQTNYTSLQTIVQSLNSDYNALTQDYNALNSSYTSLSANFDAARGQLALSTNINYTLIAITIILAVAIVYLITKRSKPPTRTR